MGKALGSTSGKTMSRDQTERFRPWWTLLVWLWVEDSHYSMVEPEAALGINITNFVPETWGWRMDATVGWDFSFCAFMHPCALWTFFEYWSNNVFHYLPCMHLMCTMYMPGSHGSQKEVWDPLGPELQMTEQQVPLAVNHLSSIRSILTSNIRTSEKRAQNGTTPVIPALGRQENHMIKAAWPTHWDPFLKIKKETLSIIRVVKPRSFLNGLGQAEDRKCL